MRDNRHTLASSFDHTPYNTDATKKLTEPQSLIDPLHYALFPEEFDHISDSIFDASQRSKGASPMSSDYINLINLRRREIGFGITYKAEGTQTESANFCSNLRRTFDASELQKIIDAEDPWKSLKSIL